MPPRLARKPDRCDITQKLGGVPSRVAELRHMSWRTWNEGPVGRGLVNGTQHTVRLKHTRECGQHGEYDVYSEMSIDDRPFRNILYCGD